MHHPTGGLDDLDHSADGETGIPRDDVVEMAAVLGVRVDDERYVVVRNLGHVAMGTEMNRDAVQVKVSDDARPLVGSAQVVRQLLQRPLPYGEGHMHAWQRQSFAGLRSRTHPSNARHGPGCLTSRATPHPVNVEVHRAMKRTILPT